MRSELQLLAANLVRGAFMELYLTPKPGLVDLKDSGSHPDLSVAAMETSLAVVSRYLADLGECVARGEGLPAQVRLGVAAERSMLQTVGTNCHKGYIFLSGLLLSASAKAPPRDEEALSRSVAGLASRFFSDAVPADSNGSRARSAYRAGGVRDEALSGYPSLFAAALPAFRHAAAAGNRAGAPFAMLGRLMTTVEDTTTLHRCGAEGLKTIREDGRKLELIVRRRGDYAAFLAERNEQYVNRNLTMGGVADMLALSFAWLGHTGEVESAADRSKGACLTTRY